MRWRQLLTYMKSRYTDPIYAFRDRLYFLFGTAGLLSAGAAFLAAIVSDLPKIAASASLFSFFIMLALMVVSFFVKDISINRLVCALFLNFFMFPVLFWVTGGIDCGMIFYFIMGLCVSALILEGKLRFIVLSLSLIFDVVCIDMGFRYPELAYPLSYAERWSDVTFSFFIVALFTVSVIIIMSKEYHWEHEKVLNNAAQLKLQALTDNLTTLFNQRYLIEALTELIASCADGGATASIVLLDIDDFKVVNDTFGHLRGNQVLCQFAALLKERAEAKSYIVTRYGGEEFILVAPGCGRDETFLFADALRAEIFASAALRELVQGTLSISGGVAEYAGDTTPDEWIRRADINMYAAKQHGKNKIIG